MQFPRVILVLVNFYFNQPSSNKVYLSIMATRLVLHDSSVLALQLTCIILKTSSKSCIKNLLQCHILLMKNITGKLTSYNLTLISELNVFNISSWSLPSGRMCHFFTNTNYCFYITSSKGVS
jgi:hypothetical protein